MKLVLLGAEVLTIFSAILVTFHPNVLHAGVALLTAFLGVAVMFLFAGADFLAGAQVVIYAGGVTILILFAVMLTHWLYQIKLRDVRSRFLVPIVVVALGILPFLFSALKEFNFASSLPTGDAVTKFATMPKTALLGDALLNQYLLPFEGITVLLLGALVGAVWIARPQ